MKKLYSLALILAAVAAVVAAVRTNSKNGPTTDSKEIGRAHV